MANAGGQTISTPINLRLQVENNEVLLKWNNPGEGATVERFAIMWQTNTTNGWGIASYDKSIAIPMQIIISSAGYGTIYFSVRADNDTLHLYSGWSNQVTLEITTPTPTPTPSPTASPTATNTANPLPSPSTTPSQTIVETPSPSPSPFVEPSPSPTPQPVVSDTATPVATPQTNPTETQTVITPQPNQDSLTVTFQETSTVINDTPPVIIEPAPTPVPVAPAPEPVKEPEPQPEIVPTPTEEPQLPPPIPEPIPIEQPTPIEEPALASEPIPLPEPVPVLEPVREPVPPVSAPVPETPVEDVAPPVVEGLIPNSPDQLPDDIPKEAPKEVLVAHIQEDKPNVENGGIEFFGTKTQPQVVGEDGKLTPPPPAPGSGDPIPPDAITTTETFIGQPGGTTFNAPDIAVPVLPIEVNIDIPGVGQTVQAMADAYVALANIGNDMSPITRKKAKKILITTVFGGALLRRIK
jgi:hypothetical protein